MRMRDLLRTMAEDLGSQRLARQAVDAFVRAVQAGLADDKYVRVHKLGRFKVRVARNQKYQGFDGKKGDVPVFVQVTFSMAPELRNALREGARDVLREGR